MDPNHILRRVDRGGTIELRLNDGGPTKSAPRYMGPDRRMRPQVVAELVKQGLRRESRVELPGGLRYTVASVNERTGKIIGRSGRVTVDLNVYQIKILDA